MKPLQQLGQTVRCVAFNTMETELAVNAMDYVKQIV
jgi:hypothetical protein